MTEDKCETCPRRYYPLTPAEGKVLRLAAKGMSNARIADSLELAEKTIERHLNFVYSKLRDAGEIDANDHIRVAAVLWYLRRFPDD